MAKPARDPCELTTNPKARTAADAVTNAIQANLPAGLSKPALRALAGLGVQNTQQLSRYSAKELLALHGMGPKGVRIIEAALAERGWSLKQ